MANIAYVRVSTAEQNEARQIEALEKHGIDKWFKEKVSGKDKNRPELQAMLEFVREGDTVFVHDYSRLARNMIDLLQIVTELNDKGVALVSNKEGYNTKSNHGMFLLQVMGALAEFERANILERQREGIAIAKAAGKYKGRKAVEIDSEKFQTEYNRYMSREINKGQLAAALGVSRPTLNRMIKEYNEGR